jgi:hypothetical protein
MFRLPCINILVYFFIYFIFSPDLKKIMKKMEQPNGTTKGERGWESITSENDKLNHQPVRSSSFDVALKTFVSFPTVIFIFIGVNLFVL